jgi:hypothetical protein
MSVNDLKVFIRVVLIRGSRDVGSPSLPKNMRVRMYAP